MAKSFEVGWYFPCIGRRRVSHFYSPSTSATDYAVSHCGQIERVGDLSTDAVSVRGKCKSREDGRFIIDKYGARDHDGPATND